MAQLDRLLSVLVSNRAEALLLEEGEPARLELPGGAQPPVTRAPLASAQIAGLLREIAPADRPEPIEPGSGAAFQYRSVDGVFGVEAAGGAPWRVVIRPVGRGLVTPASSRAVSRATPATAEAHLVPAAAAAPVAAAPAPCETASHRAMDALLRRLADADASDLHLRAGERPVLRASGRLEPMQDHPPIRDGELLAMLVSIMPERNRAEFGETSDTDFAYELPGLSRFRANVFRDRTGPGAVFRKVPATVVSVEQMQLSSEVQKLCFLTKGLVLVTGPTGSGKSTTLCALIDLVNRERHDHVITIEDPIEFVHPNKRCLITQRQVGVHTRSFKSALRAALREDPDIVLVGELRDLETVAIAIETAETGHLVFGTLHTTTAAGTIDRLIDQFPADRQSQVRVMLAESLKGVVSQTLCRRIGGGRVAAREVLLHTPSVSNLIREGKTFQIPTVMQTSRKLGMVTLHDALMELVTTGQVDAREAWSKAADKAAFASALAARGVAIEGVPAPG